MALALKRLKSGLPIAFPTETVYGLGAPIGDDLALRQVFKIKQRPFFDPLIVHLADVSQLNQVVSAWPKPAQILAEAFWPGPLTLVVPKREKLNPLITAGLPDVGVRIPRHPLAHQLLSLAGPLAAPSANRFGRTSPSTAQHVTDELGPEILVLDGGPSEVGIESSVVKIENNNAYVLRPGAITYEMLKVCLRERLPGVHVHLGTDASAPGQLKDHYQPSQPLVVLNEGDLASQLVKAKARLGLNNAVELKLDSDPVLAARRLYGDLRELSRDSNSFIYVFRKHEEVGDLWTAIWDRIEKAATIKDPQSL